MRMKQKRILLIFISLFIANIYSASVNWSTNGKPSTIPNDGDTWYIATGEVENNGLTVNGILEIRSGGSYIFNGTTNINSGGSITVLTGGEYAHGRSGIAGFTTIDTGGILKVSGGQFSTGHSYAGTTNINGGKLELTSGIISGIAPGNPDTYQSTINLNSGTFEISGGVFYNKDNTGAGFVMSGGTLLLSSGTIHNGCELNNTPRDGTMNVTNGIVRLTGGTFRNASARLISSTYLNIGANATLEMTDSAYFRNGSHSMITTGYLIVNGHLKLTGGQIYFSPDASSTGYLTIAKHFTLGNGSLNLGPGTTNISIYGATITSAVTSGALTNPSSQTMTIPSSGSFILQDSAHLTNDGTLTNNGFFSVIPDPGFTNNGTFNGSGTYFNTSQYDLSIDNGSEIIIPNTATLPILSDQTMNVKGHLFNQSSSTVDIYGTTYTYSTITNGSGSSPGTLNVYYPGKLFLLGGNLVNGHASSQINVHKGGAIYGYYGNLDTALGSLTVNPGGKVFNSRGGTPDNITPSDGSKFYESQELFLDGDLLIDYLWTITNKATINANGHRIIFSTNGIIKVDGSDATLKIKDAIVDNLSGNQIELKDTTSTLSVDNVVFNLDDNFSLAQGKLHISGDFLIASNNKNFNYESGQISTIDSYSTLRLLKTIMQYNTGTNNLIQMTDITSGIELNYATLLATQAWTIATGQLLINGVGTLNGTSTLDLQTIGNINVAGGLIEKGTVLYYYTNTHF